MPRFEDEEDYWEEEDIEEEEQDEEEDDDEEGELEELIDLSDEYIETGQSRQAIKLWRKSIDRFSDEPEALYNYARACHGYLDEQLGDEPLSGDIDLSPLMDQAVSALDEATAMDPDKKAYWNLLGKLHVKNEKFGAAVEAFRKSLELDEDQSEIQLAMELAEEHL